MEKLVLVPYDKYQRLLDAHPIKMSSSPTTPSTAPRQSDRTKPYPMTHKKAVPPPGERDTSKKNRKPPKQYTMKDWISF